MHTGQKPQFGFSIKSKLGGKSTLLNASDATRFRYEVKGCNDKLMETVNTTDGNKKIYKRIQNIYRGGASLCPETVPNATFDNNLKMIDSCMHKIVSHMLTGHYLHNLKTLNECVQRMRDDNPLGYDLSLRHDHYGFKVKSLLVSTALGMMPGKVWSGRYKATGGYIVVKEDGDVVCFHIFERNLLEDYLLLNTYFETPSTTRHNFGFIYKENDKYYFDLILQIRFT